MSAIKEIYESTVAGDQNRVRDLTEAALGDGIGFEEIVQEGFIPAMALVGQEFADGKRYIPEMLIAARAMQAGMDVVKPLMAKGGLKKTAKVVIGTVQGDLHDIGKNLVGMMMEGNGIEVIDLGVDVAPAGFVAAVRENKPQFLALSALLTTTMTAMKETMEALEEAGIRDRVKVLIGGAPVNQGFADQIGADGYGANANDAVRLIKGGSTK
jgi:5-methyltetrahydrofolate--homocysteine methyltransferase